MISLFQQHVERWKDCQRCELSQQRSRICLARGQVPCDVLMVGEAPGISEDTLGAPFKGPAGKLLDDIISGGMNGETYALTNLVACYPREAKGAGYNEPDTEHIRSCRPRLEEFVNLANPKLIVCVGSLARDWLNPKTGEAEHQFKRKVPMIFIKHPAAILRMNLAQRGLEVQRCIVTLSNAVEEL